MVFSKALALAAIFATLASAAPMQQKRAVVYETVTEVDVTTIDTTITIYPGEATPTSAVVAAVTTTAVAVTSVPDKVAVSSSTSTYIPAQAPQTSSSTSEQAPAPTSTYTPPAPTTTYTPPAPATTSTTSSSSSSTSSTTSTSSAPASTSTGSSILSGSGDGTYYETATSMSAPSYCDTANDGVTTNVVALSHEVMDESLCGATITVEYNGVTSTGTVVDKCMGCNSGSVDMSEHMFKELADLSAGRISVTWSVV